jgi:hypothetical protein
MANRSVETPTKIGEAGHHSLQAAIQQSQRFLCWPLLPAKKHRSPAPPGLKIGQREALVDGVHRHRDDLAVSGTAAAAWGAEDQDLVLAGRQRHSGHQSGEVLVVSVVA